MISRGLRINNPGNIRTSTTPWQGKVTPSRDAAFETFDTPEHGMRAAAKVLLTYFNKHKLDTVTKIISRWAPPSENDTQAYITAVSERTGMPPDAFIDLTDPMLFTVLLMAIIRHEQGLDPYPAATVLKVVGELV